jgi:hypothetical protein
MFRDRFATRRHFVHIDTLTYRTLRPWKKGKTNIRPSTNLPNSQYTYITKLEKVWNVPIATCEPPFQGFDLQIPGNLSHDGGEPWPERGRTENGDNCLLFGIVHHFLYGGGGGSVGSYTARIPRPKGSVLVTRWSGITLRILQIMDYDNCFPIYLISFIYVRRE